MNRVRKVIGIALAILVVAAGIAVASGSTETAAKQEPLQLKWFSVRSFPKEGTEIPPKLEAMVSTKVGFPVKFVLMGGVEDGELNPTIRRLLAANDLPDVWQEMGIDVKFLEQAAATFSVQFYKENMPGQYKWLLQLGQSVGKTEAETWATYQNASGNMWGAPRIWEWGWVPSGQMWRLDLVEQLGFKIPTTLDEAEKLYAAYKAVYPTKYALTGRGQTNWQCFSAVFNAYGLPGGDSIVRNGKIVQDFTTREYRDAIQVLTRWYAKGYWDPNYMKHAMEWVYNFADGNYIGPLVWVKDWHFMDGTPPTSYLENLRKIPGAKAVAAPHLRADANVKAAQIVWDPFLTQITVFGKHFEKDQEKLKKVMKVADLFSTDREVRLLSGYGIEGTHYTIPAGEIAPVATDLVKGKSVREVTDTFGFGSYWQMFMSAETWMLSASKKMYDTYCSQPTGMYHQNQLKYHYIGGTVRGAVTDEAGQPVQVTMKSDWFTMVNEIVQGKKPIEYYDEWLQAYYDGGGRAWETHATRLYLSKSANK